MYHLFAPNAEGHWCWRRTTTKDQLEKWTTYYLEVLGDVEVFAW